MRFTIGTATAVDALGFWDDESLPLTNSHIIVLWTNSGTELATATVTNSSFAMPSTSGSGQWLFTSITPLILDPGTYVVSAGYVDDDDGLDGATGNTPMTVTTASGLSWIGNAYSGPEAGEAAFPSTDEVGNGLFGADLLVPEPASLSLMLAAIGGLGFPRRRP